MDASNLLKPALASGNLRCIGSTTYKEYRNYFEKDRALVRRFQKIDVNEPTVEDSIKILKGLKPYYEQHHRVRYTMDAIKASVELAARYINDRKLPDKAIDVIDEVGAAQMLLPPSKRKKTITVRDVEGVVALFHDPGTDENEFRRYWLNQRRKSSRSWIPSRVLESLVADRPKPAPGVECVFAFDGSYSRDATGLVGCTVEEHPHVWVEGVWEPPAGATMAWRVNHGDVHAADPNCVRQCAAAERHAGDVHGKEAAAVQQRGDTI